jgi:hypothetical protein
MRNLALLAVLVLMAACTLAPVDRGLCKFASAKQVAVLSLLGDQFHGVRVGMTVFGNLNYDAEVPEWQIESFSENLVISWLRNKHALKASPLILDKAQRRRFLESPGFFSGHNYDEIVAQAKAQGSDAIVLLIPSSLQFHKPGYGFFQRGGERRCVYSSFGIEILAVGSGNHLGGALKRPCESGERDIPWREKFEEYSQSEKTTLRAKVEANLSFAIPAALDDAYFKTTLWADRVCVGSGDA